MFEAVNRNYKAAEDTGPSFLSLSFAALSCPFVIYLRIFIFSSSTCNFFPICYV